MYRTMTNNTNLVFVFGSRDITRIPDAVRSIIATFIWEEKSFLVGDCKGADEAFIKLLYNDFNYKRVKVFYSGITPRVETYDLETERVIVPENIRPATREFHQVKDQRMLNLADVGLCVWDGKSKGTKANINSLTNTNRECFVFRSDLNALTVL